MLVVEIKSMSPNKKIIILQGGSGSGKTETVRFLESKGIPKIITHTTRKPKAGEVDKKDYYFVTGDEFKDIDMVESAEYSGNIYGTSRWELETKLQKYDTVCTVMESQGALRFKDEYPDSTIIIFYPISKENMRTNLSKRGDSEELIAERLATAEKIQENSQCPYADYVINSNDLQFKLKSVMRALRDAGINI